MPRNCLKIIHFCSAQNTNKVASVTAKMIRRQTAAVLSIACTPAKVKIAHDISARKISISKNHILVSKMTNIST